MTRARLLAALSALALALPAGAAEPDLRTALRLEGSAVAGWSDQPAVGGGGRLVLRLAPVVLSAGLWSGAGTSAHDPSFRWLLAAGAGVARDYGPWQAEGSLLSGLLAHRYPDTFGTGAVDVLGAAVAGRVGVGRYLPFRRGAFAPWLGISATAAWSRPTRNRIRDMETAGPVVLLSLDLGIGAALR